MHRSRRALPLLLVSILLAPPPAASTEAMLSARIGIQVKAGDRVFSAKARNRIAAGDLLRVYVAPAVGMHVYVVHTDGSAVSLLNSIEQRAGGTIVLPGLREYYEVDGNSPHEVLTVVCSAGRREDIAEIARSAVSFETWSRIERELAERGSIGLGQGAESPYTIAGNVRNVDDDAFARELLTYSGRGVLVKRYEFQVQK